MESGVGGRTAQKKTKREITCVRESEIEKSCEEDREREMEGVERERKRDKLLQEGVTRERDF